MIEDSVLFPAIFHIRCQYDPGMIYRDLEVIQIFSCGRAGGRTNEGVPRGPRGPKKPDQPYLGNEKNYQRSAGDKTTGFVKAFSLF